MTKDEYRRKLGFGSLSAVLDRNFKLIFACNLIGSFGDGLYAYLLPVYMTQTLHAGPVEIGLLYAVMSLFAALTLLVAGILADKYDRKKIMIAGWIAWLPAPLIFAFAGDWIQMLPGMIMWGFWLGGPTTTAYVVATADKSKLTLTFTMISAAWSLGYIFSPATGGYLAGIVGMRTVFLLASALYGVACMFLFFIKSQHAPNMVQHSEKTEYSFFKLLKTRRLLVFSIFFASLMFMLMMFRPFIPKFLTDVYHYSDFEIGVLGSVAFASSAVLGILLGRLADKRRKSYALSVSMILCSIALILLLLFGNFPILIVTFVLFGGSYTTWSLMSAVVGPSAPESCRARWISIPQTVSMFSSFIAPYIGGVLYATSAAYPFMIAIVATLFLAFVASTRIFG